MTDTRFSSVPNLNKQALHASSQRSVTEVDREKSEKSVPIEDFKSLDDAFDVGFGNEL